MFSLLSLIPFVGKLVDAWSAHDQKKQDVVLEKYKVDGTVNAELIRSDVEVIKARVDLAKARSNDTVDRNGRRLFIYSTGLWFTAIVIDSLLHRALTYDYRVEALPPNLEYVPYAVVAYLLVTSFKK